MSKGKKLEKALNFNKAGLKTSIMALFYEEPTYVYNYKQLSSKLGAKNTTAQLLVSVSLQELRDNQVLEEVSKGRFRLIAKTGGTIIGTMELNYKGFGQVFCEELNDTILIQAPNMNHALDGDKVKIHVFARRKKSDTEGEVVEVLERAQKTVVGTVEISQFSAFLVPTKRMPFDLYIPMDKLKGAKNGQKAIARILDWPEKARNPFAEIVDVLGDAGVNNTEMHAILAEFGLPYKYPEKVDEAANKIPLEIPKEEIANRRDFRKVPTFTIDPVDAKDFDDALSIQKLENDFWEVGVHIADVTYYVRQNSIIEEEAYERATSVYLVDRVVPMLPERLSNGVCSLRPKEEKLCYSAVFQLDENAKIQKEWFGRTVIFSDRRFSYEEAQAVIETGEGDMKEEILTLDRLAKKLRAKRFEGGSIDFDRVEVKIEVDSAGKR